jgi:hypothetical protein
MAGRVIADQDHSQARLFALGGQCGGAGSDFGAQFLGERYSVDQLCRHDCFGWWNGKTPL